MNWTRTILDGIAMAAYFNLFAAAVALAGFLPLRVIHIPDLVRIAAAVEPVVHPHGRFLQCFNGLRLQQHAAALLPGKFQEALLIYFPIAECEVDVFPERVMQVHMMEPFPARKDKGLIGIAVEIVMPDVKRQPRRRGRAARSSRPRRYSRRRPSRRCCLSPR